jgi:hypothetical protein
MRQRPMPDAEIVCGKKIVCGKLSWPSPMLRYAPDENPNVVE